MLCLAQPTEKNLSLQENLTLFPLFSQHVFSISTLIMLSLARILRQGKDLLDRCSPFLKQGLSPLGETVTHLLGK